MPTKGLVAEEFLDPAAPTDYGKGRACRTCGSKINRYAAEPYCFLHRFDGSPNTVENELQKEWERIKKELPGVLTGNCEGSREELQGIRREQYRLIKPFFIQWFFPRKARGGYWKGNVADLAVFLQIGPRVMNDLFKGMEDEGLIRLEGQGRYRKIRILSGPASKEI